MLIALSPEVQNVKALPEQPMCSPCGAETEPSADSRQHNPAAMSVANAIAEGTDNLKSAVKLAKQAVKLGPKQKGSLTVQQSVQSPPETTEQQADGIVQGATTGGATEGGATEEAKNSGESPPETAEQQADGNAQVVTEGAEKSGKSPPETAEQQADGIVQGATEGGATEGAEKSGKSPPETGEQQAASIAQGAKEGAEKDGQDFRVLGLYGPPGSGNILCAAF